MLASSRLLLDEHDFSPSGREASNVFLIFFWGGDWVEAETIIVLFCVKFNY